MSTPMFDQFHALKARNPDAILFFRMGDFYETFFEDAEVAARVLDLTLTSRNKDDPQPVPMAGVPYHAAAGYVQRLTDAGFKVAIAEQMEDPRQAKGLVKREVVRVVTPGLTWDPAALQARASNWLGAVGRGEGGWGICFLDVSTGDLRAATVPTDEAAASEISRFEPREMVVGTEAPAIEAVLGALRVVRSRVADEAWDEDEALAEIRAVLGVQDVTGFGLRRGEPAVGAIGALLRYARRQVGGAVTNVHTIGVWRASAHLIIDETTRRNLELVRSLRGDRRGTLMELLDKASTAMGSRRLRDWLAFPMVGRAAIEERQHAVAALVEADHARAALRLALREVSDIERLVARVTQASGHARDLSALRRSLRSLPQALSTLRALSGLQLPEDLCGDVADEIDRWLVDDPPLALLEGGLIRPGVDGALDELTALSVDARSVISRLEAKERQATGINTLKIRPNGTLGLCFEVPISQADKVPSRFLPRQHLSNLGRYQTSELMELHERLAGADVRRMQVEYQLFVRLRESVAARSSRLLPLAAALSALDGLAALAEVAVQRRWTRPRLSDEPMLELIGARHPVVEAALPEGSFVANDIRIGGTVDAPGRRLIVLTGPNMAGKSTILRQTAIITLLAHMGSFVPAERATVGLCDRIFTRVGASDDLAQGQSTFMVEMSETAAILNQATRRSLVLLDEIGRGTSTYDGLSIAWAVAEDLVDRIGCRGMFATHYHELCELAEVRPAVANQSVAVSESGDRILFLRRLKEGGASRSYGIQCARLAGLPPQVVARAREMLRHFEKHAPRNERQQLSLFGSPLAAPEPEPEPAADALRLELAALDPDNMAPREALAALYRLRALL